MDRKVKRLGTRFNSEEELSAKLTERKNQIKKQEEIKQRKIKKKELKRKNIALYVFVVSIVALLTIAISLLVFWNSLNKNAQSNDVKAIKYSFGNVSKNISKDEAYVNETLMINFSDLASFLNMSVVGDSNSIKYLLLGSSDIDSVGTGREEYVIFTSGSNFANVNSQIVLMEENCKIINNEAWVPLSFVDKEISNLKLVINKSKGSVTINRVLQEGSKNDYLSVFFAHKQMMPIIDDIGVEIEFKADLSLYEEYMNPEDYNEYLLLVNKSHLLTSTYIPNDLIDVINTRSDRDNQKLRLYAAKALEALFIECKAQNMLDYNSYSGYNLSVTSGYRAYSTQDWLFNHYIEQEMAANPALSKSEATDIVLTYSARAGTSEHQSGLCVDMYNILSADKEYAKEKSFAWLKENAWKFGFILRYPEDKVDITKYDYEPWHWRYVGRKAAYVIYKNNWCLEEYLSNISR